MPSRYITARLAFRRGTPQKWQTENPVLAEGEPGFESETGRLKIGDGEKPWNELDYYKVGDSEAPGTFIHNGDLLPSHIQSVSSAIEYLGHQFQILNNQGVVEFQAGVDGASPSYLVTVSSGTGGAASHDGGAVVSFAKDHVLTLSANAFGGYEFDHWEGPVGETDNPNTTLTVLDNTYVRAHFKILGS